MSESVFQKGEFTRSRLRQPAGISRAFLRNWWIFAFVIFCGTFYMQRGTKRDEALSELSFRLQEMEKEKLLACQKRDDMLLRLHSQNDPAWIEMILMRDLGVVPEGWVKVHFIR